jgi:lysophospholipase L1-like esterase
MVSLKLALLTGFSAAAVAQNTTLRFMPFGDSITEIVCWRSLLWEKLQATEWKNVNFVGSGKTENNCGDSKYDRDNEGHSGFLAIDIANKNQLDGWLKTNPADVITMHLGTNDIVQQNKPVADILAAFTKLVGTMRAHNANMKIVVRTHLFPPLLLLLLLRPSPLIRVYDFMMLTTPQVAQIIPLSIGNYNSKIQDLNKQIPTWAAGLNKTESPIWIVDQFAGFASSDLRDGIHPNASGDKKMSDKWYPAVVNAFAVARAGQTAAAATTVEKIFVA